MAGDPDRSLRDIKLRHDVLAAQFPPQREALLAIYRHALELHLDRAAGALFSDVRAGRIANLVSKIDPLDARAQPPEALADELARWHKGLLDDLGLAAIVVERTVVDAAGESGRVHAVARLRPKGLPGEPQVAFSLPFVARHGTWTLAWSPLLAEYDAGVTASLADLATWGREHLGLLRELDERADRLRKLGSKAHKIGSRVHEVEHEIRTAALAAVAAEFADAYAGGELARALDHVWFVIAPPGQFQRDVAHKWLEEHRRTEGGEHIAAMYVADRGKGARVVDDKLEVGEVDFVVGLTAAGARRERRLTTHWVLDRRSWAWRVKLERCWR
jgi:hypothetical protein